MFIFIEIIEEFESTKEGFLLYNFDCPCVILIEWVNKRPVLLTNCNYPMKVSTPENCGELGKSGTRLGHSSISNPAQGGPRR